MPQDLGQRSKETARESEQHERIISRSQNLHAQLLLAAITLVIDHLAALCNFFSLTEKSMKLQAVENFRPVPQMKD